MLAGVSVREEFTAYVMLVLCVTALITVLCVTALITKDFVIRVEDLGRSCSHQGSEHRYQLVAQVLTQDLLQESSLCSYRSLAREPQSGLMGDLLSICGGPALGLRE